ncbi:PAS and ANTAR domain-containing protein [Mycobacterium sp. JS623]|uniref:PAS and ANTAR domain-containing protein n=1 Tax=Mycobacterium sp. JS623 TaxID=212767 RepID=UPI000A06F5EA|nr:PAS and ANTAR domain-containing protein [Mycobacterium sp. JS623]
MPMRTDRDGRDHDGTRSACLTTLQQPTAASIARRVAAALDGGSAASRVGSFSFWFADQRWEWSDEVFRMHGYEPGSVEPTTELVLSHKHPDDRQAVQDLLDHLLHTGGSFSSRHRFYDTAGDEHSVIVVADQFVDETGEVVGTRGYYVDVTQAMEENRRDVLHEALPKVVEARAEIEQAKGALRVIYGISDEQAFALLRWRSQQTNTKLRALAAQLLTELERLRAETASLRTQVDHLLLTVHERVP